MAESGATDNGTSWRDSVAWQLICILLGVIVLVVASAASFALASRARDFIRDPSSPTRYIEHLVVGFVLAISFVIIGIGFAVLVRRRVTDIMIGAAKTLEKVTPELEAATKDILDLQKQIRNIGQIVILERFDNLQERFMEITELIGKSHDLELRIVGTMLGTYGEGSLGLANTLIRISVESKTLPFEAAYFCVPGHRKGDEVGVGSESLYPFSARVAAGKILLAVSKPIQRGDLALPPAGLGIHINFLDQVDIFPAIQMWGNDRAMVLCSTGAEDRKDYRSGDGNRIMSTAVTKAMPVALMLKKESQLHGNDKPHTITRTLRRIRRHLDEDYGLASAADGREVWTLTENGTQITVKGYTKLVEEDHFLTAAADAKVDRAALEEYFGRLNLDRPAFSMSTQEFLRCNDMLAEATLEVASSG